MSNTNLQDLNAKMQALIEHVSPTPHPTLDLSKPLNDSPLSKMEYAPNNLKQCI